MLLQFKVKNFRSFKDEAVLSLEAQRTDDRHPDNFVRAGKDMCLKTLAIFGANAAGKSNLMLALTAAIMTVRMSNTLNAGQELLFVTPFKFDDETAAQPTCFETVFIAEKKKYVYRFAATRARIISEALYVYNSAKGSLIFERSEKGYRYTSKKIRTQLEPVERLTGENKLFLSTASAFNCDAVKAPYSWFANGVNTVAPNDPNTQNMALAMLENDADSSLHSFANKLLHWADVNIDDFEFHSQEVDREKFLQGVPPQIRGLIGANLGDHHKQYELNSIHRFGDKNAPREYKLPFTQESAGTTKLFFFSSVLKHALENGETICVDELDTSFHPLLISQLVGLFNNPNVNTNGAQLIFSAHTAELLSLDEFRRDQICFVSKDAQTGASSLKSLDEYSPRLNENVRRAYLLGRYGAVPDIAQDFVLWGRS